MSQLICSILITLACTYISVLSFPLDEKENVKLSSDTMAVYMKKRESLMKRDNQGRTGSNVTLSPAEMKVNEILLSFKRKELEKQRSSEESIPAGYFLQRKQDIEKSPVFHLLRRMPKGAVLHLHRESMASYKWLIDEFTTRETCFVCYNTSSQLMEFKMSSIKPNASKSCDWISCPNARYASGDAVRYDAELYDNITLSSADTKDRYNTQALLWKKFDSIFGTVIPFFQYDEVLVGHFELGLQELFEDNIQYAEVRSVLPSVNTIDGTPYSLHEAILMLQTKAKQFVAQHKEDMFPPRLIIIQPRVFDKEIIVKSINDTVSLRKDFPDFIAGYDLVGQEDAGHSLLYFINELLAPSNAGIDLPYFFHAGETNWEGMDVDENLVDAILLNTTRIGHGYAINKHPELMKIVKEKKIALEVCPISNQILGLVSDLRNHPAATFISSNIPMTVNNDDPSVWNVTGLSYDFYEVFMGMTSEGDDLRLLKQLAMDSISHTSLSVDDKSTLFQIWSRKWDEFITETVEQFSF